MALVGIMLSENETKKNPVPKSHILNNYISVTFWKWQNEIDGEQITVAGVGRAGLEEASTRKVPWDDGKVLSPDCGGCVMG